MKGAIEVVRTPSPSFLVPKAGGTWRPKIDLSALNTHIQCPSFQDGDQWVSSQSPAKRAMAHRSGFEWRLLSYPYPPLPQAVPSVLPPRRGLAISSSSVWVKHCTMSVYNGHGTCRGLRPSQWAQPPRLSRRLAVKPYIGRTSQTANPMVIGSLHSPRLGGKHGEVKHDSFSGGQLFGNFARSKRRIERWLSISEDFLAGQVQPALLWLRLLGHLVSLEKLVPYGRLRIQPIQFQLIQVNLDQGTRDSILWWRILTNLLKGIPLGTPLIGAFLFTVLWVGVHIWPKWLPQGGVLWPWMICTLMCWNRRSPSLRGYAPRHQCCHYVRQCLCHCLSEKSGGHSVSTDVPYDHRYLQMGRKMVHDTDTQTSPWAYKCASRSSEPQRSAVARVYS